MYTISPILDKRRILNSGMYPIKLRITCNKRSWYIPIGLKIPKEAWNNTNKRIKPFYPNNTLYNAKISKLHLEVEAKILKIDLDKGINSIDEIKVLFKINQKPQDFISYGRYIVQLMMDSDRHGNALFYKQAVNKLEMYIGQSSMSFSRLNYAFLRDWEVSMKKHKIKQNSIAAYYRAIRAICNQAIKDELMPQSWYPFKQFKIRTESTKDRSLTLDELITFYKLKPESIIESWAKDLFFLSFGLIGINFTDMAFLTNDSISNGRIKYSRKKTHKQYSIKLNAFTINLIDKLQSYSNSPYLLDIINSRIPNERLKPHISHKIKQCNTRIKKMGNRCGINQLTTYYSRYTWVSIAQKLGASNDDISLALGHSGSDNVTNTYLQKPEFKKIDDLNIKVLHFLFS